MTRITLAAALLAVVCTVAYADTIVLTNGGKLYGRIVSQNESEVTIEVIINSLKAGTITVKRKQIKKIVKDKKTGPDLLSPSESPLVSATPPGKQPGGKQEEEAGKKPSAPKQQEEKKEPLDPELKERIDTLVHQLGHPKRGWRGKARAELAMIGEPAVPFLIKAVESGRNSRARWGAAQVLGNIGDERATEPLIKQLRDPDEWIRKESVEALRKITKQGFGYSYSADAGERAAAAAKWEEWWKKKKEEEEKKKAEEQKKQQEADEAAKKKAQKKPGEQASPTEKKPPTGKPGE